MDHQQHHVLFISQNVRITANCSMEKELPSLLEKFFFYIAIHRNPRMSEEIRRIFERDSWIRSNPL